MKSCDEITVTPKQNQIMKELNLQMTRLRKTAACILALLSIAVSVSAANVPEPIEVIKGQHGELKTIQKVYVLPKTENSDVIPVEEFTEDKTKYAFSELLSEDSTEEDKREHTEKISIHTNTSNTQTVISKFEPLMEISTEDGYTGFLECDYSTLTVVAAGYGKQSYTMTESRSYPNLMDADTSLVPKTINKDGATLNLTNISWQSAASDNIDGHDLAVRYTAHATYSGTGTKTYTKGYTATAEYKGEVTKVVNDTVTYTVVFTEVPEENHFLSYWWAYLLGLLGLGGGGYGAYRLIRKRRKGY